MENISESNQTLQALARDLADVVEQVSPAVVAVNARRHLSSSGVYWRDGVIVTAAHTIRRTEDISVILAGGQTVIANFVGADPTTDLAVLKIDSAELSPPPFGDTVQLKVGNIVLALGRVPFELARRADIARYNAADADSFRPELAGEAAGETLDRRLAGLVENELG